MTTEIITRMIDTNEIEIRESTKMPTLYRSSELRVRRLNDGRVEITTSEYRERFGRRGQTHLTSIILDAAAASELTKHLSA